MIVRDRIEADTDIDSARLGLQSREATLATDEEDTVRYALRVADGSYDWYRAHAIRSRRLFRLTETLLLFVSAAIPVSVLIWRNEATVPGVLGSLVVVLTGLRAVFHWHENYLRFSRAREAVEAERRLFHTRTKPYNRADTRHQLLVARVTEIEQEEMAGWVQIAARRAAGPPIVNPSDPQQ